HPPQSTLFPYTTLFRSGPDGKFLDAEGPAIRSLTLAELRRYDVGRLKPGTDYARSFPEQRPVDGARIPPLAELFDLVKRAGADQDRKSTRLNSSHLGIS